MWDRITTISLLAAIVTLAFTPIYTWAIRDEIEEIMPYAILFSPLVAVFGIVFFGAAFVQRLWNARPYAQDVERFKSYQPMISELTAKCIQAGEDEELPADLLADSATIRMVLIDHDIQCPVIEERFVPGVNDLVRWTTFLSMIKGLSMVGNLKEARLISRGFHVAPKPAA